MANSRFHEINKQMKYENGKSVHNLQSVIKFNAFEFSVFEKKLASIVNESKRVLKQLNIVQSNLEEVKMQNAFKLFKYIIENSTYDISIMNEKSGLNDLLTAQIDDIYRCLCEHRSVCSSDACTLSALFTLIGIPCRHITIVDKETGESSIHQVVKFIIGGKVYYCDPTLARTCLQEHYIDSVVPKIFAIKENAFFNLVYPKMKVACEFSPINLNFVNFYQIDKSNESGVGKE